MAALPRQAGQNGWKILGSNGMGRAPTMMRNSRTDKANAIKQERQKRKECSNLWRHDGGGVLASILATGAYSYAGRELVELLKTWIAKHSAKRMVNTQ